jgi:hypothetical protein
VNITVFSSCKLTCFFSVIFLNMNGQQQGTTAAIVRPQAPQNGVPQQFPAPSNAVNSSNTNSLSQPVNPKQGAGMGEEAAVPGQQQPSQLPTQNAAMAVDDGKVAGRPPPEKKRRVES